MKNILFFGYYHQNNYGDDYFEYMFTKIFGNDHNISFYEPNKVTSISSDIDIIVCGGGDIICDYFMLHICKLKQQYEERFNKTLLSYCISVGVTYKKSINEYKPYYLDIFDYMIVRTKADELLLKQRYGDKYVIYLPDVVHGIIKYKKTHFFQQCFKEKVIGIFLTNTISGNGNNKNYDIQVKQFAELINKLLSEYTDYIIHLVPFNMGNNKFENDNNLNTNIFNNLSIDNKKRTVLMTYSKNELLTSFRKNIYSYGICMRFHSHILCYTYKVPFISISMTNKTFEYMNDMDISNNMISYTNNLDVKNTLLLFKNIVTNKMIFKTIDIKINEIIKPINNLIQRTSGPKYFNIDTFNKNYSNLIKQIFNILLPLEVQTEVLKLFLETNILINVLQHYKICLNKCDKSLITKLIIYKIFGNSDTKYNFGLEEKVLTCNLYNNLLWIYENKHYNGLPDGNCIYKKNNNTKLNFAYIDNFFNDYTHRSGWYYVSKNLIDKFHNNNGSIIVDLYLDRTFLWNSSLNEALKKIPYKNDWIGFIHHTPNSEYSKHSLDNILASPLFKISLKKCKGIFVLSTYMKNYLENIIKIKVKIYVLIHPTEKTTIKFNYNNFINNNDKSIIQIGNWLRNYYSIYLLNIDTDKLKINKSILKGLNNVPTLNELLQLVQKTDFSKIDICNNNIDICNNNIDICNNNTDICNNNTDICNTNNILNIEICNTDNILNIDNIESKYSEVNIINHLNDSEYDILLSKNIVFLNLINMSACNTLIECVIRNTPIVINRLEAAEEILGSNYPLFYSTLAEAEKLVTDLKLIKSAHLYLVKLDKTNLHINTFMNNFEQIINQL